MSGEKLFCRRCGTPNPTGLNACSKCRVELPPPNTLEGNLEQVLSVNEDTSSIVERLREYHTQQPPEGYEKTENDSKITTILLGLLLKAIYRGKWVRGTLELNRVNFLKLQIETIKILGSSVYKKHLDDETAIFLLLLGEKMSSDFEEQFIEEMKVETNRVLVDAWIYIGNLPIIGRVVKKCQVLFKGMFAISGVCDLLGSHLEKLITPEELFSFTHIQREIVLAYFPYQDWRSKVSLTQNGNKSVLDKHSEQTKAVSTKTLSLFPEIRKPAKSHLVEDSFLLEDSSDGHRQVLHKPEELAKIVQIESPISQVNAYKQALQEIDKTTTEVKQAKEKFELSREIYQQAKEGFHQAREEFEQAKEQLEKNQSVILEQSKKDLENLIASTDASDKGIAVLYHLWGLNIDNNKMVRDRIKELFKNIPDKSIPSGATPWFYEKTMGKYKYLQIRWSRTIDEDDQQITEEGDIHLGNINKYQLVVTGKNAATQNI